MLREDAASRTNNPAFSVRGQVGGLAERRAVGVARVVSTKRVRILYGPDAVMRARQKTTFLDCEPVMLAHDTRLPRRRLRSRGEHEAEMTELWNKKCS
jgi:hypothetical protein